MRSPRRLLRPLGICFALTAAVAVGCGGDEAARSPSGGGERPRLVVIGVDGGEWSVIEDLWAQGRLPHLRALAGRGVSARLETGYGVSPIIWTTIATGVTPERHGITGFVAPTGKGDVPVSSTMRRVPALWNMLSTAERRVAVVGWWASWPAEPVNGVVISDRALMNLEQRVFPAEHLPSLIREIEAAKDEPRWFPGDEAGLDRDEVAARCAVDLASKDYDLLLVYFRGVDIMSHRYWKYYRPENFASVPAGEIEAYRGMIPGIYEAMDAAIGAIVAAAGPRANVLVISDHGFLALDHERKRIKLSLDLVLERLGYLSRGAEGVDFTRTRVYSYASADHKPAKLVRFALAGREPGGKVRPEDRAAVRENLAADLAGITYTTGTRAFRVRDAGPGEVKRGGDLVVEVLADAPTRELLIEGEPFGVAVERFWTISGGHLPDTAGIFLASGPDIDPGARIEGIGIHDMTPTILAALGLPVAEDFDGRAWTELFTSGFRARHPLQAIASWGARQAGEATPSEADEDLLDELRGLGYIQ